MGQRSKTAQRNGDELIEVWGDSISLRDLLISLVITAIPIVIACAIAVSQGADILFWGMGGAVIGFVASVLIVRPKRDVYIEETPAQADDEAVDV